MKFNQHQPHLFAALPSLCCWRTTARLRNAGTFFPFLYLHYKEAQITLFIQGVDNTERTPTHTLAITECVSERSQQIRFQQDSVFGGTSGHSGYCDTLVQTDSINPHLYFSVTITKVNYRGLAAQLSQLLPVLPVAYWPHTVLLQMCFMLGCNCNGLFNPLVRYQSMRRMHAIAKLMTLIKCL